MNISVTVQDRHSYNGILMGTFTLLSDVTSSDVAKF